MYRNIISAASLMPASVLAHPGHNHSYWASDAVHAIVVVSIVAGVAMGVSVLRRKARRQKQEI